MVVGDKRANEWYMLLGEGQDALPPPHPRLLTRTQRGALPRGIIARLGHGMTRPGWTLVTSAARRLIRPNRSARLASEQPASREET